MGSGAMQILLGIRLSMICLQVAISHFVSHLQYKYVWERSCLSPARHDVSAFFDLTKDGCQNLFRNICYRDMQRVLSGFIFNNVKGVLQCCTIVNITTTKTNLWHEGIFLAYHLTSISS